LTPGLVQSHRCFSGTGLCRTGILEPDAVQTVTPGKFDVFASPGGGLDGNVFEGVGFARPNGTVDLYITKSKVKIIEVM
jgi:hypothetical protein